MQLWPKNQVVAEKDLLRVVCETCEQAWGIHKDMAGFRLAKHCIICSLLGAFPLHL